MRELFAIQYTGHTVIQRESPSDRLVDNFRSAGIRQIILWKNLASMDADGAPLLQNLVGTSEPTEVVAPIADSLNPEAAGEQNGEFFQSHGDSFPETRVRTHAEVGGKFFKDIFEPAFGPSVFRHPGADPIRSSGMRLAICKVGKEAHVKNPKCAVPSDRLLDLGRGGNFI